MHLNIDFVRIFYQSTNFCGFGYVLLKYERLHADLKKLQKYFFSVSRFNLNW